MSKVLYSNDHLKGVLTIKLINNMSIWNLRQTKTQNEMKQDPDL